ncbi:MAG: enoyl-CoA hydratase/isomerase family protein [Proteobacteria bacterium]|nr:enoyl-CoA hydratase/isomerase family protein [Pseudomonadota bacterium]
MTQLTESVALEQRGDIAVIQIDNPPVNALGISVRSGISQSIQKAVQDESVKAIVIICKGRTFCAGADIREFGKPMEAPGLGKVLDVLEACDKPVIVAVHGTAFGGGMELVLTCHFRIAVSSAKFGLPEVKLGLIPGAGGTQRLPRIVGPEKALTMITSGNPVGAEEALQSGLIDKIVDGDLEENALGFARKVIAESLPLRKISEMNDKIGPFRGKPELFDQFRKSMARSIRGFDAPEACIKAVSASVNLPFSEGLDVERKIFEELMNGAQSAAQRHYFFAERQVGKLPDIPKDTPIRDIKKVGVIGAGTMGGGITMNFVNAGIPVTLIEAKKDFLDRGLGVIRKNYEITASKGKMTMDGVEKRMAMIQGAIDMEALKDVDLVIEAVFENMALKKEIFTKLNTICKKDAILASNTSYLNINEIADLTDRPENVLGLHFFSPANVMRLLEIVRGAKTSKTVLSTALEVGKKIRKIAVVVGVCHGFAGNRMFEKRSMQANQIILEGALPAQVDKVIYAFGFPMGPFALNDLIGIDLGWQKEKSSGSTIRELLCEQGRFGLKSGSGYYQYENGSRTPIHDPSIDEMIISFSQRNTIKRRNIADQEILERLIYPVVNEGAKIIEEGIAVRASDLDVIWVNGYGWPVYLGGPMFWADTVGLSNILNSLEKFQKIHGDFFKPATLIEKLVSEGKGFKDLPEA